MEILLINHYAGSKKHGMEFRPYQLCCEWIKKGHKVVIVAASYSHLRKIQPECNRSINSENIEGITYIWLKTPRYRSNGILRFINIISFIIKLYRYKKYILNIIKPDVVIASSTYPLDFYPAKKYCKNTEAKLIFELHDLWPMALLENGGMSKYNPFVMLIKKSQEDYCKKADKIVSILPNTKKYLIEHGMDPNKFIYIPNGISINDWKIYDKIPIMYKEKLDEIRKNKEMIVGYSGALAISNAVETLIYAAELLKEKRVKICIFGQGQEKEKLIKLRDKLKLKNVIFFDTVQKSSMPDLLEKIDVLYMSFIKRKIYKYGISPNKLYDYMMSGKPIIFSIESSNNPVEESRCGITINAESPKDTAMSIIKMMKMTKKEREEMGKRGIMYVKKNHDYKVLAKEMLKKIENKG